MKRDPIVVQMRAAREAAALTLAALAQRVGIPAVVIGSWERGDRQPSLSRLRRWLASLGYDLHAAPTGAAVGGQTAVQHAVQYLPDGRVVKCGSAEEARDLAARTPIVAEAVCRVVSAGPWHPYQPAPVVAEVARG